MASRRTKDVLFSTCHCSIFTEGIGISKTKIIKIGVHFEKNFPEHVRKIYKKNLCNPCFPNMRNRAVYLFVKHHSADQNLEPTVYKLDLVPTQAREFCSPSSQDVAVVIFV